MFKAIVMKRHSETLYSLFFELKKSKATVQKKNISNRMFERYRRALHLPPKSPVLEDFELRNGSKSSRIGDLGSGSRQHLQQFILFKHPLRV